MPAKPLSGITIVDLSRLIPGPFCSLILSDLGARVIKIEDTNKPDYLRSILPLFDALNRGKKIVKLDLKSPKGKTAFVRQIKKADVLIESFRPGVLAKIGLSPARLLKANRKLIIASITGFGQKGPNRDRAGHDLNYMAMAGCLNPPSPPFSSQGGPASVGDKGGLGGIFPPLKIQYADLVGGGVFAALSIVGALFQRGKKGKGRHLDISMTDSMIFLNLANLIMAQSSSGSPSPRPSPIKGEGASQGIPDILSGILARYRIYQTADKKQVALAALEDKFWNSFCDAIEKPEWKGKGYVDAAPEIHEQLAAFFASKTRDEWTHMGERNDFCLTPVLTPEEVLESAQFVSKKNFVKQKGMAFPKTPIKFL